MRKSVGLESRNLVLLFFFFVSRQLADNIDLKGGRLE